MAIDWEAEGDVCVRLLQELIRIPTVNRGTREPDQPTSGNERPAAELLATRLREAKLEPRLFEKERGRTSVVARLRGNGKKPPLLLNAHLDVVEADASAWRRDPFGGEIHDGYVWGRGAIDMKHMAAMSTCVLSLLARGAADGELDRDVIFAGVADEENGCTLGSRFLVDEHPEEVRAEYVVGEVGGFSLHLFGRRFYPIQVAEKGVCWVRATYQGNPGHGSMPDPESAVLKLGRGLERLGRTRLPAHPTEQVRRFIQGLAAGLPLPQATVLRRLTVPQVAPLILDYLIRDPGQRRSFGALLSNTATPTVLRAGSKVNVIPGHASMDLDGRTLPGQTDEAFLAELSEILGKEAHLEVLHAMPPVVTPVDTPLYRAFDRTLRARDPLAIPVPFVIPGFTDAKAYHRLGAHCYGFSPVQFDPTHDVSFARMYHGHDERVPVDGLKWGLRTLFEAIYGFCRADGAPEG